MALAILKKVLIEFSAHFNEINSSALHTTSTALSKKVLVNGPLLLLVLLVLNNRLRIVGFSAVLFDLSLLVQPMLKF